MNGIESKYIDQIEFCNLDANKAEKNRQFKPIGYLGTLVMVLHEIREVLWLDVGENTSDQIKIQLDTMLPRQFLVMIA